MVPPFRPRPDEQLSRRDRRQLIIVAVVVVLLGVAAAVWTVYKSAADRRAGCVSLNLASSTGAVYLHHCGTEAQQWCTAMYAAQDAVASRARTACGAAGYGAGH